MAFQFMHLETYSRKQNKKGVGTDFVFDEVSREAGACSHVKNPQKPNLVYGMPVDELRLLHDKMASAAKMTNNKGQTRGIRKDQKTLLTVVLSHPGDDVKPGDCIASVDEWRDRSVAWLKEKYGEKLKTVVEHIDESHPHLHAYVLSDDEQMLANKLHPGELAKSQVVSRGCGIEKNREGDKAYRSAMREWQNDYFNNVGLACGLNRLGAGKRRLSRSEKRAEEQATQSMRKAMIEADSIKKTAENRGLQEGREKAVSEWNGLGVVGKMLISTVTPVEKIKNIGKAENAKKANRSIGKWKKQNEKLASEVANLKQQFDSMKNEYEEVLQQKDKPFRDLQKSQQMTQNILEQLVNHCIDNNFNPSKQFKLIMSQEELDKLNKEIVKQFMDDLKQIFGNDNNKSIKNGFSRF